jgi:hypothetical protein
MKASRAGAVIIGTNDSRASTPMAVVSGDDERAFLDAAMRLEGGRARRNRVAAKPVTPYSGAGEEDDIPDGAADNEARTRASRRHAARPQRSFERHHADALAADPDLTQRVLREERNRARKRMEAVL